MQIAPFARPNVTWLDLRSETLYAQIYALIVINLPLTTTKRETYFGFSQKTFLFFYVCIYLFIFN